MDAPLYNAEILRLAATLAGSARLAAPQASVARRAPICGSRVTADVSLGADGRVVAFGQEVRACALGQASAAILADGAVGRTPCELDTAAKLLAAWLRGTGPLPPALEAGFPRVALFEPARAHPARHASIALAFEAAAAAAGEALALAPAG